jgi:hypothetical protein
MGEAYQPKPETAQMIEHFSLVSRVKNASYGNNVFKTDPQFKGRPILECVAIVLDNEELKDRFLAENEEYKDNNTLATFLFGQYRKTGRTPRDLAKQNALVQDLYEKKVNNFRDKFGV